MKIGIDASCTAIANTITAGIELRYSSPVTVLPINHPAPYPV